MTPRLALAAALCVTAATALPSHAQAIDTPYCVAKLPAASAGDTSSCHTEGPPPLGCVQCGQVRNVYVVVASGAVDATLACGLYFSTTWHVDASQVADTLTIQGGGQTCTVTLVATSDLTNAVAVSEGHYTFEQE